MPLCLQILILKQCFPDDFRHPGIQIKPIVINSIVIFFLVFNKSDV